MCKFIRVYYIAYTRGVYIIPIQCVFNPHVQQRDKQKKKEIKTIATYSVEEEQIRGKKFNFFFLNNL